MLIPNKLNKEKLRDVNKRLKTKIDECKRNYSEKIESLFKNNDAKNAWKGLKEITGYKKKSCLPEVENDQTFSEELNSFYARFDTQDFKNECDELLKTLDKDNRIIFDEKEVCTALNKIDTKKASGPDKICGKVIKSCSRQLCTILCRIYQASMDSHIIPLIWLTSELVPIPKIPLPEIKNDLRPVALTAILMKSFERVVMKYLHPEGLVDPYQFAYLEGRSVEDATQYLYHSLQDHLNNIRTYARVLFVDFSSAFNTIQPHLMIKKLRDKGVNSYLIKWIHKFLTNRIQYVRFKSSLSSKIVINTGAPQGCVLSASLFTIYTSDKECLHENCRILKYADDTVIIGLLNDNVENFNNYVLEIDDFTKWCDNNFLDLNVKKTKEMIIDFRKIKNDVQPIRIKDQSVEIVQTYKYLGTVVDDALRGSENVQRIYKKANQRLFFVRKLKKANVNTTIMSLFYKSVVESVICFCMCVWYGGCRDCDKKKLKRIVRSAERLGCNVCDLDVLYDLSLRKCLVHIMQDNSHPLYHCFNLLPSGTRLNSIFCRTNRFKFSFVPSAIRSYNNSKL